jgi:hypothetical protein
MKKIFLIGTLGFFFSLIFVSCSKYEEGSYLTLVPKKMRICADWELREARDTLGNAYNLSNVDDYLKINRNGSFEYRRVTYNMGYVVSDQVQKGIWKFIDEKKSISFYFTATNITQRCPILKLTSSDFKIKINGEEWTFYTYDLL